MSPSAEERSTGAGEERPVGEQAMNEGRLKSWMTRWGRVAAALVIFALFVAHALSYRFINDDAFISFRYSENWALQGAPVYNLGDPVEGYTNFLWVALIALAMKLSFEPIWASQMMGIGFAAGTIALIFWWGPRAKSPEGEPLLSQREAGVASLLLALAPAYACWSTGGLETQAFTFFCTAALLTYFAGGRARLLSGLLLALAAMTRPEGLLLFGLVGLFRLIKLIRERARPVALDWGWGFAFALVYLPYFIWRWRYYGYPLPNTYYVKSGASGAWQPGLRYLWSWVEVHGLYWAPLLLIIDQRRRVGWGLCLTFILAMSLHIVRVGGDFMTLHRFFVPVMPALALLLAGPIARLIEKSAALKGTGRGALALTLILLVAWQLVTTQQRAFKVGSDRGVDSIGWLDQFAGQCKAIGEWIRENTPPEATLATTAAGTIPFYAQRETLDLLGLNDEWIAHKVPPRGNRPGHTKSAPFDYPLRKKIDYLIYHPTISDRPPPAPRGLARALKARGYRWERHKIPGMHPQWWGVWRRVGAPERQR